MSSEVFDPNHDTFEEDIIDEDELRRQIHEFAGSLVHPDRAKLTDMSYEDLAWEALQFRAAEAEYLRGMKKMWELQSMQWTMSSADHRQHFGARTMASIAKRDMANYANFAGLVVGGKRRTKYRALTQHTYHPAIHHDLVLRPHERHPEVGMRILTALSEVGYTEKGAYVQLLEPKFCLPASKLWNTDPIEDVLVFHTEPQLPSDYQE
jgi:hypothetical protein